MRCAAVTSPVKNSHSSATLPSCQFHMRPGPVGPGLGEVAGLERARRRGPRSRTSATKPGPLPLDAGPCCPTRAARPRAMRQRRNGCSRTGRNDASCAQYSNTAWRRAVQLVERRPRIGPEPAEGRQVVRARQHVHRVDLDDARAARSSRRSCRVPTAPAGRGSAKPCAASAMRRASAAGSRSTSGTLTGRSCLVGATIPRRVRPVRSVRHPPGWSARATAVRATRR